MPSRAHDRSNQSRGAEERMMIGPLRNNLWRRNSDKPFMWLDSRQESSTRAATQGRSSFGIILIRNPWRVDHDEKDSNQRQVFLGSTQPTEGGSHVRRKGPCMRPQPQAPGGILGLRLRRGLRARSGAPVFAW